MSADWSLSGGKRTSGGHPISVAFDPERAWGETTTDPVQCPYPESPDLLWSKAHGIGLLGANMRRREFISFMGGAAALPFATSAAMGKVPTLGYLSDEGAGPHPFRSHRPVLNALRDVFNPLARSRLVARGTSRPAPGARRARGPGISGELPETALTKKSRVRHGWNRCQCGQKSLNCGHAC
jgi:hypothetical protein